MAQLFCNLDEYPYPHTETECFFCEHRDTTQERCCSHCCAVFPSEEYWMDDYEADTGFIEDQDYDIFKDADRWPQA